METTYEHITDNPECDIEFVLSQVAQADFSSKHGESKELKCLDDLDL